MVDAELTVIAAQGIISSIKIRAVHIQNAKELHQMQKKVASDSLAYHMSSRKFEEGMLSTFDLHTAAQTLLESRIKELQMQMLLIIKQRLVGYYQGENLIR